MSFEEAATLPHSAVLALQAMRMRNGRTFKPGDEVLIDGASGNVGPFAIQVAKARGAEVTGVASGDKLDFVRSLGADDVIDYRTTDYTRPAQPYDWILDVNAHHSLLRWHRALRAGGVYVTFAGSTAMLVFDGLLGPIVSRATGKRMGLACVPPFRPVDVEGLRELVAAGTLKPVIDRRFSLDQVVEALRHVDEGR